MRRRRLLLMILAAVLAEPMSGLALQSQQDPIATALQRLPPEIARAEFEGDVPAITRVYAGRQNQPLWTSSSSLTPAGASVLRALRQAPDDGLTPDDYLVSALTKRLQQPTPLSLADADVMLSFAAVRFAHDVGWGVVVPSEVDRDNDYKERPFDAATVLTAVSQTADPGGALRDHAPASVAYRALKQALAELRAFEANGGWKTVTAGPTLRSGDTGPRVAELRSRLVERGDLTAAQGTGDSFDEALKTALVRFQDRHGLDTDGIYGAKAVGELNVPLATRIQQVRLGLERLRWLPNAYTGRWIGVNLADFRAYVFDDDKVTFQTRTVIGRQFHETPMFTGTMTYVVINPYWNVPASIARSEILPKAAKDPGYLEREHMEVDGSAVRQLPGPWNSLGRFKFMFPNPHNVYLHDTPARALFAQADRAFSHGCVRLEKPADLAAILLGTQGWTPQRIQATVDSGAQTVVTLETPVPVYISYATAFRGPDGLLHFRRDIYGRDRKLLTALEQRSRGSWEQ